jgi:hypothetical protein
VSTCSMHFDACTMSLDTTCVRNSLHVVDLSPDCASPEAIPFMTEDQRSPQIESHVNTPSSLPNPCTDGYVTESSHEYYDNGKCSLDSRDIDVCSDTVAHRRTSTVTD